MSEKIDEFCENLRIKLTEIEGGVTKMVERIDASVDTAEDEIRNRRDAVAAELAKQEADVVETTAAVKKWTEEAKGITAETVAGWVARADLEKLNLRVNAAEAYASATMKLAAAAMSKADLAAQDAWLARADANAATKKA